MNEIALTALAPATSAADVRNLLADARAHDVDTVVIAPHLLYAAGERPRVRIVSTAGWPTGNHHILVKCAEARLAVQCGASEIILVPDLANLQDQNALIAGAALAVLASPLVDALLLTHPQFDAAAINATLPTPDNWPRTLIQVGLQDTTVQRWEAAEHVAEVREYVAEHLISTPEVARQRVRDVAEFLRTAE